MDNKYVKQCIDRLDVSQEALDILKNNNIKTIEQLCNKSKSDLKKLDILSNHINKIDVELQLLGLGLKNSW